MQCIDLPQLFTRVTIESHDRHASRSIQALGSKARLGFCQRGVHFIGFEIKPRPVLRETNTADQNVVVDTNVSPLLRTFCVLLWQRYVLNVFACRGIENFAQVSFHNVNKIFGHHVVRATSVGARNMHLVIRWIERSIGIG